MAILVVSKMISGRRIADHCQLANILLVSPLSLLSIEISLAITIGIIYTARTGKVDIRIRKYL